MTRLCLPSCCWPSPPSHSPASTARISATTMSALLKDSMGRPKRASSPKKAPFIQAAVDAVNKRLEFNKNIVEFFEYVQKKYNNLPPWLQKVVEGEKKKEKA
ncbi:unnamed protein product [Caenorhabditis auriculariae]|uniref:Uncharacterized protein n=1 Tax=Caenorhabditis auriculariae TaxID=2777116 RepID=A0A8S1HGQ8_9PELO|nr:unnamed protein product [Caenorhabditis auriculariae]